MYFIANRALRNRCYWRIWTNPILFCEVIPYSLYLSHFSVFEYCMKDIWSTLSWRFSVKASGVLHIHTGKHVASEISEITSFDRLFENEIILFCLFTGVTEICIHGISPSISVICVAYVQVNILFTLFLFIVSPCIVLIYSSWLSLFFLKTL